MRRESRSVYDIKALNGQEQRSCYCLEGHTMEIDGIRMLIGLVIGITLLIMLVLNRRYAADANRRCGCRR